MAVHVDGHYMKTTLSFLCKPTLFDFFAHYFDEEIGRKLFVPYCDQLLITELSKMIPNQAQGISAFGIILITPALFLQLCLEARDDMHV